MDTQGRKIKPRRQQTHERLRQQTLGGRVGDRIDPGYTARYRGEKYKMVDFIVELPEEILLHLFTYLQVSDLLRVGCACKRLFRLTNQNVVWRWRFLANNDHLLKISSSLQTADQSLWKRLYYKASHSLSFRARCAEGRSSSAGERVCSEFVRNPGSGAKNGHEVRFDHRAPHDMSVEVWVKLDRRKPDGIIIGCQSESIGSMGWPMYHWQIMHVGPDGCVRGSLEPYKFMKGPPINDGCWHHVAITACSTSQKLLVDGEVASSTNFGIGHEYHRHFMTNSQLGNGVISYGASTPWNEDAMPKGHCGCYPFHGMIREVRIWLGMLPDSTVRQNMYVQRIDLAPNVHPSAEGCSYSLLGYWPMNRLVSGPWPWQGSLVTCTSHLKESQEKPSQLRLVFSCLPQGKQTDWVGKLSGY